MIWNYVLWLGETKLAVLLMKLGLVPPSHVIEDEKFSKENGERTYIPIIQEFISAVIWHIDYVKQTNEETMTNFFSDFKNAIKCAIVGATIDGWSATKGALRNIFKRIHLQQCTFHPLLRLSEALKKYQASQKVDDTHIAELKQAYWGVFKAKSRTEYLKRLRALPSVFKTDYFLKPRYNSLKTKMNFFLAHLKDQKLAIVTTRLDQTIKFLNRKLDSMQTFREEGSAKKTVIAWAIARNFFRYYAGAKNAGKSPVEIGGADLKGIPWLQVVNILRERNSL